MKCNHYYPKWSQDDVLKSSILLCQIGRICLNPWVILGDVLSLFKRNGMLPLYVIVGVFHNRSVAKTGATQGPVKRLGLCIECRLLVANSEPRRQWSCSDVMQRKSFQAEVDEHLDINFCNWSSILRAGTLVFPLKHTHSRIFVSYLFLHNSQAIFQSDGKSENRG